MSGARRQRRYLMLLSSLLLLFLVTPFVASVRYGDIVPCSPAARMLATLEAVMGQIYLTVLIARLVGLHIVHASSSTRA